MLRIQHPIIFLALLSQSACGLAFQTVAGWSETGRREVAKTSRIALSSSGDDEARFARTAPSIADLGKGSAMDSVPYTAIETFEGPSPRWPLLLGALIDTGWVSGVALGFAAGLIGDHGAQASNTGIWLATAGLIPIAELIAAAAGGIEAPHVLRTEPKDAGTEVRYTVERPGARPMAIGFKVSGNKTVVADLARGTFAVDGVELPAIAAGTEARTVRLERHGRLDREVRLAVAEIEDANEGQVTAAIDRTVLKSASAQLRSFLSMKGVRVVAKPAEASLLVHTKLTRFGDKCVLNVEIANGAGEPTAHALADGTCDPAALYRMTEALAIAVSEARS